jgi:putative transposase
MIEKFDLSQVRASRLAGVDPKTVRRRLEKKDESIRERMRAIAGERRRFGYRRIGVLLAREGMTMNKKKLYRLYREEGLAVKRGRGRKRATGTRAPLVVPTRPNERWSLDFLSDVFGPGRRFRILAVIDDATRESLGLIADTSISGRRVARELDALIRLYSKPQTIVSDNVLSSERSTGCGQNPSVRRFRRRQGLRPQICRAASAHKRRSLSTITNAGCARRAGAPHRP